MSKKQIDDMQKRVNGNNFHCPEYMNLLQGLFQVKNIDILDRKKIFYAQYSIVYIFILKIITFKLFSNAIIKCSACNTN